MIPFWDFLKYLGAPDEAQCLKLDPESFDTIKVFTLLCELIVLEDHSIVKISSEFLTRLIRIQNLKVCFHFIFFTFIYLLFILHLAVHRNVMDTHPKKIILMSSFCPERRQTWSPALRFPTLCSCH